MLKCFLIVLIPYGEWLSGTFRLYHHYIETQHHQWTLWRNAFHKTTERRKKQQNDAHVTKRTYLGQNVDVKLSL